MSSKEAWQESVDFMQATGLLENPVEVDALFTNRFVENQ
jgi:hypothetical protein